jgi:hypothetical protein
MCEFCMSQPTTAVNSDRGSVKEPALNELLRDPMTLALMAADRVDRHQFDALLSHVRTKLR